MFVDGVRRLEARAWIDTAKHDAVPGIFASYAAGAVRCSGAATLEDVQVGRGLFAPAPGLDDVVTRHGTFEACKTKDAAPESINYAVHERMTECEVRIAEAARRSGDELIVLDGPLRKGQHIRDAIGFVKTHHVRYLPEHLNPVVGALAAGERTPLFRIDARPFSRTTWYVRLPGPAGGPWAGIVRCEASGTLPLAAVVELADTVTVALPRFASVAHKDPRAPQNLAPDRGARAAAAPPPRRCAGVLSRAPCRERHARCFVGLTDREDSRDAARAADRKGCRDRPSHSPRCE